MVVLALEKTCEVLHHSLPKLLLSTTLLSGVILQGVEVAIVAVSEYLYLISVFRVCVCTRVCSWCVYAHMYVCTCGCVQGVC